ncbi:MAG: LysM peptidoglycan-binding domain-containing protein [Planctomycetota bacterium]
MRTEVKLGLIIGLIVIGGGIFYAVNQSGSDEQSDTLPFDVTVSDAEDASRIDLAADRTPAPGTSTPSPTANRPITRPLRRDTGGNQANPPATDPGWRRSTQPLPPITGSPDAGGRRTPTTRPAVDSDSDRSPTTQPATTQPARTPVVTPPRETITPPPARPSNVRDASKPKPAATKYTIKRGDRLYAIAEEHYGDGKYWTKIRDANPGIDPDKLKIGQEITLPPVEEVKGVTPTPAAPQPGSTQPPTARATYVVEEGDTLISIARNVLKDGDRWREIYDLNRDKLDNPDVIPVGTELKLPPLK